MRFVYRVRFLLLLVCMVAHLADSSAVSAQDGSAKPSSKIVGTIKSLNGNNFVVTSDDGAEVKVSAADDTRFLQVNPGEKDLKQAVPIHLQDLQASDRVLVRGTGDNKAITAATVIVMKKIALEAKQQGERQDWQKRGIGGLVSSVDPATGDIAISITTLGGKKEVVVHTTKTTVVRRYAPNSVQFDDARPSTLADITPGDQVRARGTRSEDGAKFMAEEIVSGSFRNIAGTISALDSAAGNVTVADAISKKPVKVKVTAESQLRKLPAPMAQRIATRLKGGGTPPGGGAPASAATTGSAPGEHGGPPQGAAGGAGSAAGDLQQVLSRLPASSLADFQKGDAVMIVSTEGRGDDEVTAITLLGGVEPILTAAPSGKDMVLSPWSLSAPEGGGGSN
jgi:hypothetical protein